MLKTIAEKLRDDLTAAFATMENPPPHVKVNFGCLATEKDTSVMILVCLEPKETWSNGIMENSNYFRMSIHDTKIEHFSGWTADKFRKSKFKDSSDCFAKIEKFIRKLQELPLLRFGQ